MPMSTKFYNEVNLLLHRGERAIFFQSLSSPEFHFESPVRVRPDQLQVGPAKGLFFGLPDHFRHPTQLYFCIQIYSTSNTHMTFYLTHKYVVLTWRKDYKQFCFLCNRRLFSGEFNILYGGATCVTFESRGGIFKNVFQELYVIHVTFKICEH